MARENFFVKAKKLKFVLFLCLFISGCNAGVFGRFKFDEKDVLIEAVPAQVKHIEKRSISENPALGEKRNKNDATKHTEPVKSPELIPIKLTEGSVKLNSTKENDYDFEAVKAPVKSKQSGNKKKTTKPVKKSQNLPDLSLNGNSDSKSENLSKKQISAPPDLSKNGSSTLATNETSKFVIANQTIGSNIFNQTGFPQFGWVQNNHSNETGHQLLIPDANADININIESSGDTSGTDESINELKSDVSNKTIELSDTNVSEGLFPAGSFDFLMNFNVAKNAAMAMEVFNLTDSSLTDHILEENEFHGLLDLMNPTLADNKESNSTEQKRSFNGRNTNDSDSTIKSNKVSEEINMTLQNGNVTSKLANLTVQAVNETFQSANLTVVLQVINETTERVNATVLEAVSEITEWVNATVLEAINQTVGWANVSDIMEAVNETVEWINSTVLEAVNQTVERINAPLLVAVNQTVERINSTLLNAVNQTVERINATVLEANQTERINTVFDAVNQTVDRINTTILDVLNQSVDGINTVMEAISEAFATANNTVLEAENQTVEFDNLTQIVFVGNATNLGNISNTENKTEVVSEIDLSNSSIDPKCPPPGICLFWFLAQDTCAVNSHCLGTRICCRIRCSKTCIEI